MSKHVTDFSGVQLGQLSDENALLRASLAEARERLGELEQTADTDPLTGLPNLRRFTRELELAVHKAERHAASASLLYIDIVGLEEINQRHGRVAGDAALIHLSRLLTGLIRSTDFLARTDGDLFALILDHLDHNSAIDTSERLARCIAGEPVDLGGVSVRLATTIGTTAILPGDSVEGIIDRAERSIACARTGY